MYGIVLLIIICFIVFKMSNKNKAQSNINYTPEYQFELERMNAQKKARWIPWLAFGSLLLLLLIIVICFGTCIIVGKSDSPAAGWLFVVAIWFIPVLAGPMIMLNVLAKRRVTKCETYNIIIPSKTKNLIKFNYFQIPIIVISIVLSVIMMSKLSDRTYLVKEEIEKRYGTEYTILYQEHSSDESGTNEIDMLVKSNDVEIPLCIYYDIVDRTYTDNYEAYLNGKKLGYEKAINNTFKKEIFSYMEVDSDQKAWITLFVEPDQLKNKKEFTNNIKKILDKYSNEYDSVSLNVFSVNSIDHNNEYEYKLLATSLQCDANDVMEDYSHLYNSYIDFYIWGNREYNFNELYENVLKLN